MLYGKIHWPREPSQVWKGSCCGCSYQAGRQAGRWQSWWWRWWSHEKYHRVKKKYTEQVVKKDRRETGKKIKDNAPSYANCSQSWNTNFTPMESKRIHCDHFFPLFPFPSTLSHPYYNFTSPVVRMKGMKGNSSSTPSSQPHIINSTKHIHTSLPRPKRLTWIITLLHATDSPGYILFFPPWLRCSTLDKILSNFSPRIRLSTGYRHGRGLKNYFYRQDYYKIIEQRFSLFFVCKSSISFGLPHAGLLFLCGCTIMSENSEINPCFSITWGWTVANRN